MSVNLLDSAEESFASVLQSVVQALKVPVPTDGSSLYVHSYTDAEGDNFVVPVYTGKASTDGRVIPNVIVEADGAAEEEPNFTGNYWLNLSVQVRYVAKRNPTGTDDNAADPKTDDKSLVSTVASKLSEDDLWNQVNLAALSLGIQFTVFPNAILRGAPSSGQDESGAWVDEFRLRIYACASTLS